MFISNTAEETSPVITTVSLWWNNFDSHKDTFSFALDLVTSECDLNSGLHQERDISI